MGQLIRTMDWSTTPLGPIADWPQSLRTSVSLCLSSTFPILIAWGPETIQLYNDSYRPICGAKHPESMGQNFRICWETALPVVGDAFTRGQQGEGTYIKDQRMLLDRYGYLEEAFMTFSFAPIRDETGQVGGIFHPITETTDKMLSARRTHVLREVAARTGGAKTKDDIYTGLGDWQTDLALDLPFLLFYELVDVGQRANLVQTIGLVKQAIPSPLWSLDVESTPWLANLDQQEILSDLISLFGPLAVGPYPETPHQAVRLPIQLPGQDQPVGFLLAGVSALRALDEDYLNFYGLLGNTIATAFSNVYAYQQEQQRAEALAVLDQAKTTFFSNISHEFRTPLTLMLGPLEELQQLPTLAATGYQEPIETIHRNALRLLKLVNNLLDFSRLEAGRTKAIFRPTNLWEFTQNLASSFRSLIERAGLRFEVVGHPLRTLVPVDADMWEQIVLNLLSNAFKYTLQGSIQVQLQEDAEWAVLTVSDTGVGIPASELPHMFERFHRVANAGGRTHEGTGIGLSLASELVSLHQGTIEVHSQEGKGSTFTVRIPMGGAASTSPAVDAERQPKPSGQGNLLLQEASAMLPELKETSSLVKPIMTDGEPQHQILVVDDNADMRSYLKRLLDPHFVVNTVTNGMQALEWLQHNTPQLILSDLMMPVLDGSQLLQRIRLNPATRHIPLIFLSARAGQEARIEGLEAGADDYLVKPFSGPELLSRVRTQVSLVQSRRQAERRLRNLLEQAPVAIMLVSGEALLVELINPAMLTLIDREEGVVGKPLLEIMPELDGNPAVDACKQVWRTGVTYQGQALPVPVKRQGKLDTGYYSVTYTPYQEGGLRIGVLQVVVEVTDQVKALKKLEISESRYKELANHLEQQVQERTHQLQASIQELQRSNLNLSQFAYVASHDLQEPLRKIQSFGDLLSSRYAASLGEGADYVAKMQSAASRMSILIKDLLLYSQITTRQQKSSPVSITQVIERALSALEFSIQQTGAFISVETMPTLLGDSSQLSQLFQNLISNALKFRRPKTTPTIHIQSNLISSAALPVSFKAANPEMNYHQIDVTDNGIGFEEKYLDRVFQVFQRLHTKSDYAGTGIGLAICEKVAANHGGFITASSKPGQGATFTVYLPA
ncbi:histidine kinase [Spirosoma radiotolerans]|uniref:histidine kinase n=2 Tax=Spirosoma radiotolerans TaxID=1379870 RepID=A0A0E4A0Q1_9BACT|nr:histidine kinase [Spirosoma radiotolerans]